MLLQSSSCCSTKPFVSLRSPLVEVQSPRVTVNSPLNAHNPRVRYIVPGCSTGILLHSMCEVLALL